MTDRDLYAQLGVSQHANSSETKSAFRTLAQRSHPDKTSNDDSTAFRHAHEAYETLSNPKARSGYDSTYRHARMKYSSFDSPESTRTAAYDAEQTASQPAHGSTAEKLGRSPPPTRLVQNPLESDIAFRFSKRFVAWQKRFDAYCTQHPWYKPP
jgi:DnaJ-class molecular chaperone